MVKLFLCILLFALCNGDSFSSEYVLTNTSVDRIVGGEDATIDIFPYQVFVSVDNGTVFKLCGGSIISPRYILTAAHCVTGINVGKIVTVMGSTDTFTGGKEFKSKKFYVHPMFNNHTLDYNVAVIKLPKKLDIDDKVTKVIELADSKDVPNGEDLVITGWGATSENNIGTDYLKTVTVQTISSRICRKTYSFLTERMFCAGVPEGGKDFCQGDSGGPAVLTSTKKQVGIISFGRRCGRRLYPSVYIRVGAQKIRDWIKNITHV